MIKNVNLMRGDIIRMGGMAFIRWRWRVRCVCWHTTPYLKALGRSQLWKLIDVSSIPSSYRWQENFTVCSDGEGCRRQIWHWDQSDGQDQPKGQTASYLVLPSNTSYLKMMFFLELPNKFWFFGKPSPRIFTFDIPTLNLHSFNI